MIEFKTDRNVWFKSIIFFFYILFNVKPFCHCVTVALEGRIEAYMRRQDSFIFYCSSRISEWFQIDYIFVLLVDGVIINSCFPIITDGYILPTVKN